MFLILVEVVDSMKKITILSISFFIISSSALYIFSFLNIFYSLFIPFFFFGIPFVFLKYNTKIKVAYVIFYSIIVFVSLSYTNFELKAHRGVCHMNIPECMYGTDMKYKIDKLIKKESICDMGLDWDPYDFLFGVYRKDTNCKNKFLFKTFGE